MIPSLALVAALFVQAPAPAPPAADPARTKAAIVELDKAFAKTDAGPRIRAIEAAALIDDAEVARGIGRGLDDRDLAVQRAAIEALRFHPHAKAADELLARARQKSAKDDLALYATLLRALGQRGDPRAIDVLTENPWSAPDAQVLQAKILGLGRIRTKEAVKALTDLMEVAGPHKIQPFMKDFRLALWSLTGADQGESAELWMRWYRENKAKLAVAPDAAAEPRELSRRWTTYWAKPGDAAATKRDRPRGEDRGGERK